MASDNTPKSSRALRFINYTKEAFFFPVHLATMGVISVVTAVAMNLPFLEGNAALGVLAAGIGLELMALSTISKNERFVRAINAKYSSQIDDYYKTKTLVDYYNRLSQNAQQRFDRLKTTLKELRERYKAVGKQNQAGSIVGGFLEKLNQIELSYIRLLYYKDKFPELSGEREMDQTIAEIDNLNRELKETSSAKLKEIKEKRLKLLDMRMQNFGKIRENKEIIEEKLQTIEDMVDYIKDQPMTMMQTDRDDVMIDNILFETEQTQNSLQEIEGLIRSEFSPIYFDETLDDRGSNKTRY